MSRPWGKEGTGEPRIYQPLLRPISSQGACHRHPLQGQGDKVDGRRPPGGRAGLRAGGGLGHHDCRRLGRECRRDSQCCSRNCVRRGDDKVCACPEGQTLCKKPRGEGRCVNLQTNERHCGSCFNRCAEGEQCVNGVCSGGEPICDPPCTQGRECVEGAPGFTFCQPICPSCACSCFDLPDGSGGACVACNGGCPSAPNNDCSRCETDFPGTICVLKPASTTDHLCCQPASPPPP